MQNVCPILCFSPATYKRTISNGNNAIDLYNKTGSFIIKILYEQQENEENSVINCNTYTPRCRKL